MKRSNPTKNLECDYSFEMLYKAAFGKSITKEEKTKLKILPQREINKLVIVWAKKAGWVTESKKGVDKKDYIAFYPKNF